MPRQRFIWPNFWTDPILARLKPIERLFYVGCFSNADDDGRLLGDAAYLRSTIFPYDDLSVRRVTTIRDVVVGACKSLEGYEVDGVHYLAFRNWREWQKPKYPSPSKLPAPDWFRDDSGNDSGKLPESLEERSSTGREGQGRDGLNGSTASGDEGGRETAAFANLGIDKELELQKILDGVRDRDDRSIQTWRTYAERLPLAALVKVRQKARGKTARYISGALKSELRERGIA